MKASVVIPTKNGGDIFLRVLDAVKQQKAPWAFEVLVVDSGSRDQTVAHCLARDINVISIAPSDFGHGKTRNLGISKTCGEFVALITQDAVPANSDWLFNLVSSVEREPDIAGAFGRHLAYPDASPYTERDLKQHFDYFHALPAITRKADNQAKCEGDLKFRKSMHFFSNNNACLRRTVWEKIPFPDVDFAEDQIWAKCIIEAGYGKAYANDAAVYHSHNYSTIEAARRAFDESAALKRLFGYKLCPTLAHLFIRTIKLTIADLRFSLFHKARQKHFFYLVRSPFFNLARTTGLYLGKYESAMPAWLLHRISLDQSLKANP